MIFRLFLAVILLAPLPFASAPQWAWSILVTAIALLLLAWSIAVATGHEVIHVSLKKIWYIALPFGLVVLWAYLQTTSLFPPHPLWAEAAKVLGEEVNASVTLDAFKTLSSFTLLLCYGVIFWLALQYGRDPKNANTALWCLAIFGFLYASYGLAIEYSGSQKVLWYTKFRYDNSVTSTFINGNSYATYAGMGLLCVTALISRLFNQTVSSHFSRRETIRKVLIMLTTQGWFLIMSWIILVIALLQTESRAGLISTVLGLFSLFVIRSTRQISISGIRLISVGFFVIGAITLFANSGTKIAERFSKTTFSLSERQFVFEQTFIGIQDNWIFGTGYGTFEDAFRLFRDNRVKSIFDYAHNTYLEIAIELGLPATFILMSGFIMLMIRCFKGIFERRQNIIYCSLGLAVTLQVAAHSLLDFSMQMPAVAVTYSAIMGIAVAQSWSRKETLL